MILTALALLTQICGVETVVPIKDGVAVTFSYSRSALIHRDNKHSRNVRIGRRGLKLRTGETLDILNFHDGCRVTVQVKDGQLGVEIWSWDSQPEQPYSEITVFVPAQRR